MESRNQPNSRFSIPVALSRIDWRAWLPSRGNVIFTLIVMTALFWAQSVNALPWMAPTASATSTSAWPYQGRLADSSGNPITATIPMIFRLYNSPDSGATPLWEEQWTGPNSVQVSDGLFNVMLGSLIPIPQDVVTGNGSLWLGITAGTDDEMTPRIQLGSMPYAVQALTVPDGSITPEKLNLPNGKVCLNNGELSFNLPGEYATVDVPDLSITFDLERPSQVLVWSTGLARYEGPDNFEAYFMLNVDNEYVVSAFTMTASKWFNTNGQRLLNLSAGEHTMYARLQSAKAGYMVLHDYAHIKTCLYYVVIGTD